MNNGLQELRMRFCKVIDITPGSVGELIALDTVCKDIKYLSTKDTSIEKLGEKFNKILISLNADQSKINLDLTALKISRFEICKAFVTQGNNQTASRVKSLYGYRAALLINHLKTKKVFAESLIKTLKALLEGKYQDVPVDMTLTRENIIRLQREHSEPGTAVFKLLSSLIRSVEEGYSLDFEYVQPAVLIKAEKVVHSSPLLDIEVELDPQIEELKVRVPHEIHQDGDLLAYKLDEINYATPKVAAGNTNGWWTLNSHELEHYLTYVNKEYREIKKSRIINKEITKQREILLGILLSFHISAGPARWSLVRLKFSPGHNVWLDLDSGCLCWNRLALIKGLKSKEIPSLKDIFCIPLPSELIMELKIMIQRKSVEKVGQLFETDLYELQNGIQQFVNSYSDSAHKPHLGRLITSSAGYIYSLCGDDAYTACISLSFSLSSQSTFYYFSADPARVNAICEELYSNIGYQHGIFKPIENRAGSQLATSDKTLFTLMREQLHIAEASFNEFSVKIPYTDLVRCHNKIAVALMTTVASVLGLRPADEYSICSHTTDLESRLILITDKASSPYLSVRLLPIPKWLIGWLKFYSAWLTRLAKRLNSLFPELGVEVSAQLQISETSLAIGPTFFLIIKDRLEPIGSTHIKPIFEKVNLPVNVGRHVMDFQLRQLLNSSVVNIFMSHANPGQEGLGLRSALPVDKAMEEIAVGLTTVIERFQLPGPPKFHIVEFNQLSGSRLEQSFRPKLWKVRQEKSLKATGLTESCPFHELTLLNARRYKKIFSKWVASSCHYGYSDLALSLIFFDGVVSIDVLSLAISELTQGRIYSDDQYYFIDVVSTDVGLQRVILSTDTLIILQEFSKLGVNLDAVTRDELIFNTLEAYLVDFRHGHTQQSSSLELVCEFGKDFYSSIVHGPLREMMKGNLPVRTIRPQSYGRHKFNLVERMEFSTPRIRNSRFVRTDSDVVDALNIAVDNSTYGGSNSLRIKNLEASINSMMSLLINLFDLLAAEYIINLCKVYQANAPGTIRNHYMHVRPFLKFCTTGFDSYEECATQDWMTTFKEFQKAESLNQETIKSIKHLFTMLGIETDITLSDGLKKITSPKFVTKYTDYPSDYEIDKWAKLISNSQLPSTWKKQSLWQLRLINDVPERRQDVATFRLKDICKTTKADYLIITSQTTGSKKSANANRVVTLPNGRYDDLMAFAETKKQVFSDSSTGLFSQLDQPDNFKGGFELLAILSQAGKAVTGNINFRPHLCRTGQITKSFGNILSVKNSQQVTSESLRLALHEMYVFTGHGDLTTVFKYYVCDMEWMRREWVDHISSERFLPNPAFYSSLKGLKQTTLTKYSSNPSALRAYVNKYLRCSALAFLERVVLVREYLVEDIQAYAFEENLDIPAVDRQMEIIKYRMICLAGARESAAAILFNITESDLIANNKASKFFKPVRDTVWKSYISTEEVLPSPILKQLLANLSALQFSATDILTISQLIPASLEEPWDLDVSEISLFPDDLFRRLRFANIDTVFYFCDSVDSKRIEQILSIYNPRYWDHQRRRNFKTGKQVRIKFVFKEDKKEAWPIRSKTSTGWVSLFLISLLINNFQENLR